MANRRIEEHLEILGALRGRTVEEAGPIVRRELADRSNVIVAKAAKVAGELGLRDTMPDMVAAYERLFEDAVKRDPQCWGKIAIARTLRDMEYADGALFLRGARWVQFESVWGGQADTAAPLRAVCLLALPACDVRRETVMRCLVEAFAGPDPTVRGDAARAIALMGGEEAALLLRLKARTGDESPAVTGQVLESLLSVERTDGLEFAASFLQPIGGEAAEEAALAIGASRMEKGVEMLTAAWEEARGEEYRGTLLRALGISRRDEAAAFLRDLVENGRDRDKAQARAALELLNSTATCG
jgi:HEAT repeat protein